MCRSDYNKTERAWLTQSWVGKHTMQLRLTNRLDKMQGGQMFKIRLAWMIWIMSRLAGFIQPVSSGLYVLVCWCLCVCRRDTDTERHRERFTAQLTFYLLSVALNFKNITACTQLLLFRHIYKLNLPECSLIHPQLHVQGTPTSFSCKFFFTHTSILLSNDYILLTFFPSTPTHFSSGLCSPLLIFDCNVTTCPHTPETLGQGASENTACKDPSSPPLRGSASTCGSLMPAVSSHYLIGIEMHLARVFFFFFCLHCSPDGDTPPSLPPSSCLPSLGLICAVLLGEGFLSLPICGQTYHFTWLRKKLEMAPNRSQLTAGSRLPWFAAVNKSTAV